MPSDEVSMHKIHDEPVKRVSVTLNPNFNSGKKITLNESMRHQNHVISILSLMYMWWRLAGFFFERERKIEKFSTGNIALALHLIWSPHISRPDIDVSWKLYIVIYNLNYYYQCSQKL